MLVEEGPRWDDGEEGQCRAAERNVDSQLDILQEIADDEGESLVQTMLVSKCNAEPSQY